MDGCLSGERLAAYVDGRLDPEEREVVESHVARCDRCLEEVALLMRVVGEEARLADTPVPERVVARAEALIAERCRRPSILELVVKLKEDLVAVIRTTGEILSGELAQPVPVRGRARPAKRALVRKTVEDTDATVEVESRPGAPVIRVMLESTETHEPRHGVRVDLAGPSETETRFTESGLADFGPREPGCYRIGIEDLGHVDLEILPPH